MRVVFELEPDDGVIYVVNVTTVDDVHLIGWHNGVKRIFLLSTVKNATTVTGRPFSLRLYQAV